MSISIWKVRRKAGDNPDYFSYSLCKVREAGQYPIVLTAEQFAMLFPGIDAKQIPEAPLTKELLVKGELI